MNGEGVAARRTARDRGDPQGDAQRNARRIAQRTSQALAAIQLRHVLGREGLVKALPDLSGAPDWRRIKGASLAG